MKLYPRSPADQWTAARIGVSVSELSQEKLEAWQIDAFRKTLYYAKTHSRFYANQMKDVDPESLQSMEDIRALPFTSEKDLSGRELDFLCVSHQNVSRIVTVPTTGTSGQRKRLSFTLADQKSALAFIYTGFLTMCEKGDRMLVMMSGGTQGSIGDAVGKALEPLGITTEVHGPVLDIADAYAHIQAFRPNVIVAIPNQIAAVAHFGERFGNPEREYIRSVLLSADDVPESVCQRLRNLWGCNTFRHYGMTEMCIAGGVECLGYAGYHLRACDLLFEVVDADEEGFGEIVLTTLGREAMPLIRYRTGDIGRMTDEPCPCGSVLRRIETIRGRKRNLFAVGKETAFLSEVIHAAFSVPETVDCECTVGKNRLELVVKTLPGEMLDLERIQAALIAVPSIGRAVAAGDFSIELRTEEMDCFPAEYNLKKKVTFQ